MPSVCAQFVRIDLESLTVEKVLDLTAYRPVARSDPNYDGINAKLGGQNLRGFIGGAAWGQYGLLFPHRNDMIDANYNGRPHSSLLVRVDLNAFDLEHVLVLDLASVFRQQVPRTPEASLRGFLHGFVSGAHAYLVPHFSRVFFGKIVRVDMRDFEIFARLQLGAESTDIRPVLDGGLQTTGVQFIDLEREHPELVGFSGGYPSRSEGQRERTLSEENERVSWRRVLNDLPLDDHWLDSQGNDDGRHGTAYTSMDYGERTAISTGFLRFCETVKPMCTYNRNMMKKNEGWDKFTITGLPCPCAFLHKSTQRSQAGYDFLYLD
jgi:hypothetical protein